MCTIFVAPVVADPIAGYDQTAPVATPVVNQSPRATSSNRQQRPGRSSAATKVSNATIARNVSSRGTASRGIVQQPRNVVSRSNNNSRTTSNRVVRARTATNINPTRISVSGASIRASAGGSALASRLYTGTYSNIIDPTTGLISADAYSNCLESYYACMDEICTARNPGQRRCACAGRVKTLANVVEQLQRAKEDLLTVSGQLSLLISTKGKAVTEAFTLTEAEKVLNCVSYRDAEKSGTKDQWCQSHTLTSNNDCEAPSYCSSTELGFGGSDWMNVLDGSDSDILANLETYASTINEINVISTDNTNNLWSSFMNVSAIVGELDGTGNLFNPADTPADTLAKLWGYDLFQYAHNNVCNRVLDSCFNGIYEACGSHNGTTGPYNYNSTITVNNDGMDLNFVQPGTSSTGNAPSCFGYSSTAGDPYSTLRRPVADARRSILQKYALDANADCDVYGEELKKQATNMAYQKIAATQFLQKKRLEFAQEEQTTTAKELAQAKENYRNCVNEVYDCYDHQSQVNPNWTVARIKNYCAQSAEVPSCYKTMVCDQEAGKIIDIADNNTNCENSQVWSENTCRNIVRLSEILNGTGEAAPSDEEYPNSKNSAGLREYCLQHTPGVHGEGSIREFESWAP